MQLTQDLLPCPSGPHPLADLSHEIVDVVPVHEVAQ
jgi:hypothetical protein